MNISIDSIVEQNTQPNLPKKRGRKPKPKPAVIELKIPKKRGRKPKPKPDVIELKVPKKRGRKPKPKSLEDDLPKIPKKRGRKPKDKYGIIPKDTAVMSNLTDGNNIILHLPIKSSQLNTSYTVENILEYNPDINEPIPYEPTENKYLTFDNKNTLVNDNVNSENISNDLSNNLIENNITFDNNENYIDNDNFINKNENLENDNFINKNENLDNDNFINKNEYLDNDNFINNNKNKNENLENGNIINKNANNLDNNNLYENNEIQVDESENEISVQCKFYDSNKTETLKIPLYKVDYGSNRGTKTIFTSSMVQYYDTNQKKEIPKTTSTYCWWCCHPFKNQPCVLPTKSDDNIYHVIGNFCSPECAASYNFASELESENVWERYSLLNSMYKRIYDDNKYEIKLAPPRNCLKIFGGHLTIDEFRAMNSNYDRKIQLVMPPIISIIPQIEESNLEINKGNSKDNFIPIDKDRIKKANDDLRLKRNKPITESINTLENCMRLKYI